MSPKPLTIFLSSTFSDLVVYREAVHSCVISLENHADDMVYWSADERSPSDASVDKVRNSDLVLLIIAHRYGSIPVGGSKSIVELEYEAAKEKHVPILAFIADPSYPWPPDQIDYDPEPRAKLDIFKRRVETECIRHLFTTPDSLVIAVTQAIANLDRRQKGPGPLNKVSINQEVIKSRPEIRQQPDVTVGIGQAEDGMPLVLRILRSQDLRTHLERLASSLNRDIDQSPLLTVSNNLTNEGVRVWRETGLHDVELRGNRTLCYVSYNTLTASFTPSLVLRLLTAANNGHETAKGLQVFETSFGRTDDTSGTIIGPISARRGYDKRVQSSGGANRFLAVSLDSEEVSVVGWNSDTDIESQIEFWRPFVNESILGFSEWNFELIETHAYESTSRVVATGDSTNYINKVHTVLERPKYYENTSYATRVQTSLTSLVEMIARAASRLYDLHKAGYVHGDIKPQNMLLSEDGVALIDSLNLNEGDIPPGLSPDWASPEQLLMHHVSKATDIYPFGLMLAMVLGAELSGELVQYSLPSRGGASLRVPMLKNPVLYLDVEDRILSIDKRRAWFDFVERCLRYVPSERYEDAGAFGRALEEVSAECPLRGQVEFEIRATLCPELALLPDGSESPCRMITDRWTSIRRPAVRHKW